MVETNGRNFDLLTLGQVLLRLSPQITSVCPEATHLSSRWAGQS